MIYDLDKTQEWLNRTQQIGRTPALRGGVAPDDRSRRHTILSVLFALSALLLICLVYTRLRPVVSASASDAQLLKPSGPTRVEDASATYPSARVDAPAITPPPSRPNFVAPALSLDGGIVPLPGHVAPSAPIWLDGVPH